MQGNDCKTADVFFGLTIDWDPQTGKPRVNATDVKPGEEKAVTDLATMMLGAVNEAVGREHDARPARAHTPTVNEAIAAKLAAPGLKPTTQKEYKRAFALFAERMGGETRLADLPQERFAEFADFVSSMPNLAAKTKGFYITSAQGLYTFYSARNGAVPTITTKGLKPKRLGPPERRRAFTLEELEVLFRNAARYRERKPAKWWITVATVFLGGRIEELTQAHVDGDFRRDPKSGIYYLNIAETSRGAGEGAEASPKSVKTEAGWRKVPIHPCLVNAGFLDFVEGERKAGASTAFQQQWGAHRGKEFGLVKHSHAITKWGGRELDKLQAQGKLPKDNITYFHSMRHSFVTLLAKAGIEEEWRAALAGHEYGQMSAKLYNHADDDVAVTLPIVERGLSDLAVLFEKITEHR
jgi:integrase